MYSGIIIFLYSSHRQIDYNAGTISLFQHQQLRINDHFLISKHFSYCHSNIWIFFIIHFKFCSRMRRCLHWPFPVAAVGSASSLCFVFYPYNACFETTLVSPSGLAQSFLLTVLSWGHPGGGWHCNMFAGCAAVFR